MKYGFTILALACVMAGCKSNNPEPGGPGTPGDVGKFSIVQAFPNVAAIPNPIELTAPNDGSNRIFVASVKGSIHVFAGDANTSAKSVFLDISNKVATGGELGLLGLAFHPDYKTNGYFYVNYTRRSPGLETVIARYKVSAGNANQADASSEEILLTYGQPYDNHNGGKLAFGNDSYLYIASGDGGSGGDPQRNGQNKNTLLGKILRIDVNTRAAGKAYNIPADNPFKGTAGAREEIFAYGLRNPWKFSVDRATGMIVAADVGQDQQEEIDVIEKGGNYGWVTMEGTACYGASECNKTGLVLPIHTYGRADGKSITGGFTSRDKNLSTLAGRYVYGDFVTGNIWALTIADKKATGNDLIGKVNGGTLSSFGEDSNGNLYILNYSDGKVYKLVQGQ